MTGVSHECQEGVFRATTSGARIPELDGLRGLAILLVIVCHYVASAEYGTTNFWLGHFLRALSVGWSGVDLFFVLSGFLIGGILIDSSSSPAYFRTFYLRRVYRILPIYYGWIFLYAVIVAVGVYVLPAGELPVAKKDLAVVPTYLLFLQNMIYSPSPFEWRWFVVTWSLAVEEQFYIFAPPLIRFLSPKRLVYVLGAVICIAPILRYLAFRYLRDLYYLPQYAMPCRADALALGILAAVAWRWPAFRAHLENNPGLLQRTVSYMLVLLAMLMLWLARPNGIVTFSIGYTALAVFYTSLMLLAISQRQGVIARMMRARWLRYLGGISYCVYLIHLTMNEWAHRILLGRAPRISDLKGISVTLLAGLLTWFIASLSWKYFEKPLIEKGHRYSY
jgi:peptidoglycan/LPS O-acetylase OafA/YrhL